MRLLRLSTCGAPISTTAMCARGARMPSLVYFESHYCSSIYNCFRKLMRLSALPEVLCIVIKRFKQHEAGAFKLSRHVHFPSHDLDLAPYLSSQRMPSTCNQSQTSGHVMQTMRRPCRPSMIWCRWCATKADSSAAITSPTQSTTSTRRLCTMYFCLAFPRMFSWSLYDDSNVTPTTIDVVLDAQAYMLFYR